MSRLILALDVETLAAAERLAELVDGAAGRLKVGLELFTAHGPAAVRALAKRGGIMLDLKLHDIPATVARAAAQAAALGVDLLTVHVAGGRKMMEAAVQAVEGTPTRVLGVTVLTSLDDLDLAEVGIESNVQSVVTRRATMAMECGLHGVVASVHEAAQIRAAAPEGFLIVTPGVRPAGTGADDQARRATPAAARQAGADFVVVGRPIRDAADPRAAALAIAAELSLIVYGQNPVRELVLKRPKDIHVVYLAAGDTALKEVYRLCADRGVAVEDRPRAELDKLAGPEARHQGVVAIAGELPQRELEDVLDDIAGPALIVVLDGVQDPRNLGAIVRSAHVLGAHAVVIAKDRAAPVTATAVKASAGATEHLPVVVVTNLVRALETLKERGIWTVGAVAADTPKAVPPSRVDLSGPIALVLGAEEKGLRPLVLRSCDHVACIPMVGKVASLNVSVAAGILLYEVVRQRAHPSLKAITPLIPAAPADADDDDRPPLDDE